MEKEKNDWAKKTIYKVVEILRARGMVFYPTTESAITVIFIGHLPKYPDTFVTLVSLENRLEPRIHAQPALPTKDLPLEWVLVEKGILDRIEQNLGLPLSGHYAASDPKRPEAAKIAKTIYVAVAYFETIWAILLKDKDETELNIKSLIRDIVDAAEEKAQPSSEKLF